MKEIVLNQPEQFEFREARSPEPDLAPGQVRVKVHRVGICGTDIHAFYGRQPFFEYPRVLGHELGVEVIETADANSHLPPGTLCAVEPYLNNSESQASRRGMTNCCEDLNVLGVHIDGGMRAELVLPATKLHPSNSLNIDQLALVETLCIGAHAIERARPQADDNCLIIGAGPIGLGCAAFASQTSGKLVVVDIQESRLAFCRESIAGVTDTITINPGDPQSLSQKLRDLFGGDLPSLVIDATGNPKSMAGSFDLAANGARIVFAGLFQGDLSFHDPTFHRKELSILATRNATADTFRDVMKTITEGTLDTENWIGARIPFDHVPVRFAETVTTPGLVKAVVEL